MRYVYVIWMFFLFSACELGRELDIQSSDESAGYFLECYFRPGDLYNLTATKLAPISEPQLLDYSLEFQVHVIGDEKIKLYHSLFSHPDKDLIYNYGSQKVAERPRNGIIKLEAVTPTGEVITGETIVPEQITIHSASVEANRLCYDFELVGDKGQDYYIATVMAKGGNENILIRYLNYYDYKVSNIDGMARIQVDLQNSVMSEVNKIIINLKRVSKENYEYQLALREIMNSNSDNLTMPVMLQGNLTSALGIFTCYTEVEYELKVK